MFLVGKAAGDESCVGGEGGTARIPCTIITIFTPVFIVKNITITIAIIISH